MVRDEWNDGAARYAGLADRKGRYRDVAAAVVEAACLRPGMHVVDLACGSGAVTNAVLDAVGGDVRITAIDFAEAMLAQAAQRLPHSNVRFVHGAAEDLSSLVSTPVDRVLCSAALWQMNIKAVLRAIRTVLAPDGCLVISVPASQSGKASIDSADLHVRSPLVWLLLEERALMGRPVRPSPAPPRTPQPHSADASNLPRFDGFAVTRAQHVTTTSDAAESLDLLEVTPFSRWSGLLRGLSDEEIASVLRTVRTELTHIEHVVTQKQWSVYVLTPTPESNRDSTAAMADSSIT